MSSIGAFTSAVRPSWGNARRRICEDLADNFKIERGIPIPRARLSNGAKIHGISAVLRKLRRGDSVWLPINHGNANATASRVMGSGTFTTRREGAGVRVWRVR